MMLLKPKPKSTLRKEQDDNLSILTSIQRYRRQPPPKIGSSSKDSEIERQKENIPGRGSDLFKNRMGMFANGNGTTSLRSVPSLVTTAETRSILHSLPANIHRAQSQSQNDASYCSPGATTTGRTVVSRPLARNASTKWAIFSSEPTTRKRPIDRTNVLEDLRCGAEQNPNVAGQLSTKTGEFPAWLQGMIRPPGSSDTDSIASSKFSKHPSRACLVQGAWIERNSKVKGLTDPKVTVKYSIAQIMDIFTGNVPPPEPGFFGNRHPPEITIVEEKNKPIKVNKQRGSLIQKQLDRTVSKRIRRSSPRPLRRQLLPEFDEAESSTYFSEQNLFEDENSVQQRQDKNDARERQGGSFFQELDVQDCTVPVPSRKKSKSYFGDIGGYGEKQGKRFTQSVLNFGTETPYKSSKSRTNFFNIGDTGENSATNQKKESPFSIELHNKTPLFKIPQSSRGPRDHNPLNITDITGHEINFNNTNLLKSSLRDKSERKKKSLRFADFDPIPCSNDLNPIILFPERNFALQSAEPPSNEISRYNFEGALLNSNADRREDSYLGGLGIIQNEYHNTLELDLDDGSQQQDNDISVKSQSKWDEYKDPYSYLG